MKNTLLALACIGALVSGCKDEKENELPGSSKINIYMTDAPAVYNAVNVDVQGVALTGPAAGELMLTASPGIYNLLDLTNGNDTLLASGTIDAGTISQIRLILGNNNSVTIDSVTYPLSTPSAQQSGLKLQVHKTFEPGVVYNLLLDFDAQQSIVDHGNGTYSLKPVIRVIEQALTGSIKGSINPVTVCNVTAVLGNDTASTYVAADGRFLLQGLAPGNYSVTLTPDPPLNSYTDSSVTVTVGNATDMGVINF